MAVSVAPAPLSYPPCPVANMGRGDLLSSIKRKLLCGNQETYNKNNLSTVSYSTNNAYQSPDHWPSHFNHSLAPVMGNKTSNTSQKPQKNHRRLSMSRRSGGPSHSQQLGDQKSSDIGSDTTAPPAYTAVSNASVPVTGGNSQADDPYAFLATFDTVFLIDDSGSMAGRSWRETRDALETIIPVCVQYDTDGIDINFLNARDSAYHHNITSSATVREIFSSVQPRGATPTGQRLSAILKPYLRSCEANLDAVKPLNLIVITDGVPTDDVESALILAAKKLDKLEAPAWQIGVQFFQVGNDESAKQHLKQLDDELSDIAGGEIRDMVDTVPFMSNDGASLTGEGIMKVVLGAVNRRLDRKKSKDLHR